MLETSNLHQALQAFTGPSGAFFYQTAANRAALQSLQLRVRTVPSIVVLTGPEGVGKTTLLAQLLLTVSEQRVVLHGRPGESGTPLLHWVNNSDTGVRHCPRALRDWLLMLSADTGGPLACIDDAHELRTPALSNLLRFASASAARPVTLVLVGDERLVARLAEPHVGLRSSGHFVALAGLTRSEFAGYLRCCLRSAGLDDRQSIDLPAQRALFLLAEGRPGEVNRLASTAIANALREGEPVVHLNHVQSAARVLAHSPVVQALDDESLPRPHPVMRATPAETNRGATTGSSESENLRELERRLLSALDQVRAARQQAVQGPAAVPADLLLPIKLR